LIENVRAEGLIHGKEQDDENASGMTEDITRYKFYKFYKPCGEECDLILDVIPHSSYGSVLSVLINYDNPAEASGNAAKLPTW